MTQGVEKQVGILSAIEAECHLVQVGREVLCADLVPCAHDAALEQGECGLDSIGMNITVNINAVFVLDRFVLCSQSGFLHGTRQRDRIIVAICICSGGGGLTNRRPAFYG